MSVGKRKRFEVFKRDGFTCQYCGATPPDAVLEVDHIEPVALGGGDEEENLVTACLACNRGKSAVALTVIPESLAERAARIAEAEEQLHAYRAVIQEHKERQEDDVWRVFDALEGRQETTHARFESVRRFTERLPLEEVIRAAETARSRMAWKADSTRFRYFCGICWNLIRDIDGGVDE